MMVDPKTFKESLRHESLEEIIKVRDRIIREIRKYEKYEPTDIEVCGDPSPDTIYYNNLSYLSELCGLIQEKIQEEERRILKNYLNK